VKLHWHAWRYGLVHPFYVPAELHHVRMLLAEGRLFDAISELSNLTSAGSDSAAATLRYMLLRNQQMSVSDDAAIERRCRASANRYAYAQYVVACAEYQRGNFKEYSRWLHRAARQNFAPALGDVGRAFIATDGSRKHSSLAKRYLMRAIARGHLLSLLYLFRGCKEGKFGNGMAVLGHVAFPLTVVAVAAICRLFPFSAGLFSHPFGIEKPLFAWS
jgi:hypothetical protein